MPTANVSPLWSVLQMAPERKPARMTAETVLVRPQKKRSQSQSQPGDLGMILRISFSLAFTTPLRSQGMQSVSSLENEMRRRRARPTL